MQALCTCFIERSVVPRQEFFEFLNSSRFGHYDCVLAIGHNDQAQPRTSRVADWPSAEATGQVI